jgi:hypothetical protein
MSAYLCSHRFLLCVTMSSSIPPQDPNRRVATQIGSGIAVADTTTIIASHQTANSRTASHVSVCHPDILNRSSFANAGRESHDIFAEPVDKQVTYLAALMVERPSKRSTGYGCKLESAAGLLLHWRSGSQAHHTPRCPNQGRSSGCNRNLDRS